MNLLYRKQWQSESAVNTLLHDVFSGIRVVKVFGTEKREEERFDKRRPARGGHLAEERDDLEPADAACQFLMGIGEYAVLLFVGAKVIEGEMTLGALQPVLTYVGMLYGPIRWAAFIPRRLTHAMTSMAKIFELLDEEPDIRDLPEACEDEICGNIEFDNVASATTTMNMCSKTSACASGEMIGVVGRSGVGKSTMINLIMRLYDVNRGVLRIEAGHPQLFAACAANASASCCRNLPVQRDDLLQHRLRARAAALRTCCARGCKFFVWRFISGCRILRIPAAGSASPSRRSAARDSRSGFGNVVSESTCLKPSSSATRRRVLPAFNKNFGKRRAESNRTVVRRSRPAPPFRRRTKPGNGSFPAAI